MVLEKKESCHEDGAKDSGALALDTRVMVSSSADAEQKRKLLNRASTCRWSFVVGASRERHPVEERSPRVRDAC